MITFEKHLTSDFVPEDLKNILLEIAFASTQVAVALRVESTGLAGSENVHGEKQLALDVFANEIFTSTLKKNAAVNLIASEEMEDEVEGLEQNSEGYSIAFDPLDGSSLVDVNLAVGSIFGIYKGKGFLNRTGREQVAAMIFVYGPKLSFLITVGQGVQEFIYEPEQKQFFLNRENIKLQDSFKMFAPGNLRACESEQWYTDLVNFWLKNKYTLRYSGGMVPDVNQILLKGGGIFTYPGYKDQPLGKLRLLYECAPMAFLIEQADGKAVSNNTSILDLEIKELHQRTPIFLGSKKEVEIVRNFMKKG